MNINTVKMSVVTAMLLSSGAYAGQIITDANLSNVVVTENTQFGFGGWNFDNVEVRMVDLDGDTLDLDFNTSDGTYDDGMVDTNSFDSDILGGDNNTTIMGELHGKDYPVGEPAGIKIINGDINVQHGKPENCIMTTSYLDTGYLGTDSPKPVICSSDWQTHKRFKVNLLPTTVANIGDGDEGYGKWVDLVFNLDPTDENTTITRYQVLQKINNYTGKRLKGYKIEVLDENKTKNVALTLSLGEGEDDNNTDIWADDDMANMSHGLWGPYEENQGVLRFDNGFFDHERAYYAVDLNLTDNNQSLSYVGDMLGGNYQEIFGNWLPSVWEPMGIFHDDDNNSETDGILKAFFGTAPGYTEDAWYKSTVVYDPAATPKVDPVYTWALATDTDFLTWSGALYEVGAVEDVLNLGVNYIVNIGKNSDIGATFTIRITPYVDSNQTAPSYVGKDATIPDVATTTTTSSGGGGCTYNPNSKNFDMTFLMLMALGLLYPFRRRFLK